jgi:hypothetical protein
MSFELANDKKDAKIHGLSVQVGELFADIYKSHGSDSWATNNALEAYKSLRRLLPHDGSGYRRIGSKAAHAATQGQM